MLWKKCGGNRGEAKSTREKKKTRNVPMRRDAMRCDHKLNLDCLCLSDDVCRYSVYSYKLSSTLDVVVKDEEMANVRRMVLVTASFKGETGMGSVSNKNAAQLQFGSV
jgi:hypothetical protein